MNEQLQAFRAVDFDWVCPLQSIWHDPPFNVEGIHASVIDDVMDDFGRLAKPGAISRIGRVLVAPAGFGKTHLMANLRRRVWQENGWFVLLDIVGIKDFWRTTALGFINSLHQLTAGGKPQYEAICLAAVRATPREVLLTFADEVERPNRTSLDTADLYIRVLARAFPQEAPKNADIVRALLLLQDPDYRDVAYSWMQGPEARDEKFWTSLFRGPPPEPYDLVRGISWLMSLGGPTMIGVDQIDSIVTESNLAAGSALESDDDNERRARSIIEALAGGLMDLRDVTSRAITVVTCLGETWTVLQNKTLHSATQRFTAPTLLQAPPNRELVASLIERRLREGYASRGFVPPYPTWPFTQAAIASADTLPPRKVLMSCDAFQRYCKSKGAVIECTTLVPGGDVPQERPKSDLDERFRAAKAAAQMVAPEDEGNPTGGLLRDVLGIYSKEVPTNDAVDVVVGTSQDEKKPPLHARLTFIYHDKGDREQHFCFRVIEHAHHRAFQPRMRAAMTAAGIDQKLKLRHLVILRNAPPPGGAVTEALVERFRADGGKFVPLSAEDARTFIALRDLAAEKPAGFEAWLQHAKPLQGTVFFQTVGLTPPPMDPDLAISPGASSPPPAAASAADSSPVHEQPASAAPEPPRAATTAAPQRPAADPAASSDKPTSSTSREVPVGRRIEAGGPGRAVAVPADLLPRHTAIFAGSGSGKTVLLRRLVEEAALLRIPAIVLDTNNDLARLGDPWPQRPDAFSDEDAAKALRYGDEVEVVVWTPNVSGGRPLSLSLLPNFSSLADEDERFQAVDMARATLKPMIGAGGTRGALKEGVLADGLAAFARGGRNGLDAFIDFLADLPDDVSGVKNAGKLAADIADQLRAKIAVNPMLRPGAQSVDPGALFAASTPGKTRISVINFAALQAIDSRQDFVNQLQMTLFTWIRNNPSPTGRLYVVDEAQNFAPSQGGTACKASSLALAAQARKYGLGMIFATQAPKGIDNQIVSNCTTHFYGRQSSPATIEGTKEMMAAKGGAADDLARLERATFYFATEGTAKPFKVRTPLCLSHHPANPLSGDEIAARARATTTRT